jgi:hypothetical protein
MQNSLLWCSHIDTFSSVQKQPKAYPLISISIPDNADSWSIASGTSDVPEPRNVTMAGGKILALAGSDFRDAE